MRVYVEPIPVKPTLWIMGHGSIAESMCAIGDLVGLDVVVNDSTITRDRYPAATRLITDDLDYRELKPKPGDFVIVATQHKGDHESMKRALAAKPNYIALIDSRKRAGLVMDYLRDAGSPEQELDRSEEHTSELHSLMRHSYAVFCVKKTKTDEQSVTS